MDGETSQISGSTDLRDSDKAIFYNITSQLLTSTCLLVVFLFLRKTMLWLYAPNTRNKRTHPAYTHSGGIFSWIVPVLTVKDVELVSVIGLDSFMLLQTIKMLYRILFIAMVLLVPLLIFYARGTTDTHKQLFLRICISNLGRSGVFILPMVYTYVITLLVFYLVYVYFKKFVSLRQAYIRSPALLTPLTCLKRMSFQHEDYLERTNLKAKSVVLTRIPPFIETDNDLRLFVEALGCGTVEDCVLIRDTTRIDEVTDERDMIVRDIEGEIERTYLNITREIEKRATGVNNNARNRNRDNINNRDNNINNRDNINNINDRGFNDSDINRDDNNREDVRMRDLLKRINEIKIEIKNRAEKRDEDIHENTDENTGANTGQNIDNENNKRESDKENKSIIEDENSEDSKNNKESKNKIREDKNIKKRDNKNDENEDENSKMAFLFINSKNKYIKRYKKVDALTYKMRMLERASEELKKRREEYSYLKEDRPQEEIVDLMNQNNILYTRVDITKDVSFFSLRQLLHIRKNAHLFTLDLPTNTRTAFLTFLDAKSAQILPQCLISSRVFSCTAFPAPDPSDIIWENVNRGEVEIYFKNLLGNIIFVTFCLVFYTLVFALTSLIQLEQLEKTFPSITAVTSYSFVRNSFNGIVTPFIYSQLLGFSPLILSVLTYYEGVMSYSSLYVRLMERYGYFLLFNGFIAILCSSTFTTIIAEVFAGSFSLRQFTRDLSGSIILLSVFFTNTIIQKTLFGNMFMLVKPVRIFMEFFFDSILSLFGSVRSRRAKAEARAPEQVNLGIVYPNIFLTFAICITYSIISPIMTLFGGIYYAVSYFIYKEEFLFCIENEHEAGGMHWEGVADQVIAGLYIFQVATLVQFVVYGKKIESLAVVPVVLITYIYKKSLYTMFSKSMKYYPLNEQEENYIDEFTGRVIVTRKKIVEDWEEVLDPADPDIVLLNDVSRRAAAEEVEYPYRVGIEGLDAFMFPKGFFETLRAIREMDPDDTLEIFKEVRK